MKEIILKAQKRKVLGKQVKQLRRQGKLPAVIYGHNTDPFAITLDAHEASRILPTITSSHLVVVDVEGEKHTTLVREKQRHPVQGGFIHIDFQEVSLTEKLKASVVIELVGDAPAVKNLNGVVVAGLESLEVECLPQDLPERITVDISGLTEIGSAIYVRDIPIPANVEVLESANETVVVITSAVSEAEEGEAVAGAAEPEVIERGKKQEENF